MQNYGREPQGTEDRRSSVQTEQPEEGGKEESGTGRECKVKGQTKGKQMGEARPKKGGQGLSSEGQGESREGDMRQGHTSGAEG